MMFEMAPNNFKLDFEQIYFNPLESPVGKVFQYNKDPDLNYSDETNIVIKEMAYINDIDIKNVLYEKKDLGTFVFLVLTSKNWKPILKTSAIF